MSIDPRQVSPYPVSDLLGADARYLGESAGRTVLFRGRGRVCKVFLPRSDGLDRADREMAALRSLANSAIPVPGLLDSGEFAEGARWVLMTELPGHPASIDGYDTELGRRFQRLRGRVGAMVHGAGNPSAFGMWTVSGHSSLAGAATEASAGLAARAITARPERKNLCAQLRSWQVSMLDALKISVPVLVHGDLGPGNLLLAEPGPDGRLTGVLDWETADTSIPAAEFSGPAFFGDTSLRIFAEGYAEIGSLEEITGEQVAYYVADRVMQVFGTTGGRWNPQLDQIAESMAHRLLPGDLPRCPWERSRARTHGRRNTHDRDAETPVYP